MKKFLSLLLTVAMLTTMFATMVIPASADDDEPVNLVAGMSYTPSAPGAAQYTGANNALTDGYTNRWTAYNETGFCWNSTNTTDGKGYFIFDLGESCTLSEVKVHVYVFENSGVLRPAEINIYVSDDGDAYEKLGSAPVPPSYAESGEEISWATLAADDAVANYVKVEFVNAGGMNILDEIEIWGTVNTAEVPSGPTGEDEANAIPVEDGDTVTVPAGATLYYSFAGVPGAQYNFTATGATGFSVNTAHPMTGMPIQNADVDGTVTLALGVGAMWSMTPGVANFSITNNTDSAQDYELSITLPVGTMENPAELVLGDTDQTSSTGETYYYIWTATEDGYFTINMNASEYTNGWEYTLVYGPNEDLLYHTSNEDPATPFAEIAVSEGDVVKVMINNYDWAPDVTVTFNTAFSTESSGNQGGDDDDDEGGNEGGNEGEENYVLSTDTLVVGESSYIVDAGYEYTVFAFEPTEIGEYTISSTNAILGIVSYNGMWVTIEPSADTITESSVEWDCTSVGQSIWVAVKAETNAATITVERNDNVINQVPVEDYENTTEVEDFTFEGDVDALENVDIDDEVVDTAVLGEDGFYHLNTVDGPILYVNISDEAMSLLAASSYGQLKYTIYEDGEAVKVINFLDAFTVYSDAADAVDATTTLYPLTADLMAMFQNIGAGNNWYGENGFVGGLLDDAWMFACYYLPAEDDVTPEMKGDVNGNGKLDGRDYLLLKRAYFGTYELDCALETADINGNGKLDGRDYLLLKRAYFGTYTIEE